MYLVKHILVSTIHLICLHSFVVTRCHYTLRSFTLDVVEEIILSLNLISLQLSRVQYNNRRLP